MPQLPALDLEAIVRAIGYPAAALGILIETMGIPFPGETTMLIVSAYAAQGHLDIRLVTLVAVVGTVLGGDLGYLIGYRGGRPFVERFLARFHLRPHHLASAERLFLRYGPATLLFARFLAGLRQWSAMLAGMARMPFWRFQFYNVIGGTAWAVLVCLTGFFLGNHLELLERLFKLVGFGGVAALLLVIAAVWLFRKRAARSPH